MNKITYYDLEKAELEYKSTTETKEFIVNDIKKNTKEIIKTVARGAVFCNTIETNQELTSGFDLIELTRQIKKECFYLRGFYDIELQVCIRNKEIQYDLKITKR